MTILGLLALIAGGVILWRLWLGLGALDRFAGGAGWAALLLLGLGLAIGGAAVAFVGAARAQGKCDPREEVVALFERTFGETVAFQQKLPNGLMFELLLARDGAWTIITTDAGGTSCLVATGVVDRPDRDA